MLFSKKGIVLAAVLMAVLLSGNLFAQNINNNNANTQPQAQPAQQQQQSMGGLFGFLPFPFFPPLPPLPIPFFGGFGFGQQAPAQQAAGQQGTNNNQNVVVKTGEDNSQNANNEKLMEMMSRILELLEKQNANSPDSKPAVENATTGTATADEATGDDNATGENALNE